MRSALAATALGITLSVAALASCASPEPGESPGPSPSITPVFASEEEALGAAENAYQAYLDVSNEIAQAGWVDTANLSSVERSDALDDDVEAARKYADKGYRQVGSTTFDSIVLQQLEDLGSGSVVMVIYLCLDVSEVDVVDATGASVVSPDRPARQPLEVELDDQESDLKLTRSEVWTGNDFC